MMAKDTRKHQKKLERRKAKNKARNKSLAANDPRSLTARIERSASAPVLHCCTTTDLFDEGMAHVLISRRLDSGNVAFAMFLLDVYCLGVKNVFFDVLSRVRYDMQIHGKLARGYEIVELTPEAARKLVEGAVEYANELGLPPHKDYPKAQRIFGDVDASLCTQEFKYGKDGKPLFISGPHDTPARCNRILRTLQSRCGPDNDHDICPAWDIATLEDD